MASVGFVVVPSLRVSELLGSRGRLRQACRAGWGVYAGRARGVRLRELRLRGGAAGARGALTQAGSPGGRERVSFSARTAGKVIMPGRKLSLLGLLFLLVTYLWSFVLFLPMLIMHPFVLFFDRLHRRFHDCIAMAWMKLSMLSVLIRPQLIHPENMPPKGMPAVFVANHTSVVDIYACGFLGRHCKYVSKAGIFRLPVVGWAMAMTGNISLKRRSKGGKMEAYRKMVRLLSRGISLVVFPEGTRSPTGKLSRFKRGAFRAAKAANVPVVPVTITGTREMMPSHAYVPLRYPTDPIRLEVHPPIAAEGKTDVELRDEAFKAINSGLPKECQTSVDNG